MFFCNDIAVGYTNSNSSRRQASAYLISNIPTLKPPLTSPKTFSTGIGVLSNTTSQAEKQMTKY